MIQRECGKCKGKGGFARRQTTSVSQMLSGDSGWTKCSVCGGSGTNPNYREKKCERCGWRTLSYHKDAQHPPRYCDSCKSDVQRERAQKEAQWREKRCTGCSATIKYNVTWTKVPDLCKSCIEKKKAEWREKRCTSCGNTIKYNVNWTKIPDLCNSCIERKKTEWKEKPCGECGKPVRYHMSWDHIPNFCKECKEKRKSQPRPNRRDNVPEYNPNPDAGSISGFHSGVWTNERGDGGKVLKDDNEPGISTHVHRHKDGTTISTYKDGKPVGRYNLDTGEDETRK